MKRKRTLLRAFAAIALVVCCLVSGCTADNSTSTQQPTSQSSAASSGFNEEQYIWEGYIPPTNKTEAR